jgi:pyruvate dehydrogenase (quinone)
VATVGDFLVRRLHGWGVRRIYGYPGDGINGIVAAIHRAEGSDRAIDFIQVRHEEMAAFMACAHAKFTGELGVCLATSGPGAIHLLNGLYDAKLDHVPVLAITGQAATSAMGSEYQQEVDLQNLFKDVASEYLCTVVSPAQVTHAIDRAIGAAVSNRTVTALFFPKDLQEEKPVEEAPLKMNFNYSGIGLSLARLIPYDDDVQRAADVLNAGSKVAMLIGAGCFGAESELIAVADKLQAGCAKALLGKGVLSDELPWVTGSLGLLGTRASHDMMKACDTLFMIGTNYPYSQFLPKPGDARGVQIDTTGERMGIRYPTEVNLQGERAARCARSCRCWSKRRTGPGAGKLRRIATGSPTSSFRVPKTKGVRSIPERVWIEFDQRVPDDAILTCDAGTTTNWVARLVRMRGTMKFSLSGGLATMGPAVPYAIAAKFAFPNRPVLALTGDGAMQMNGLNALITVKRYLERWVDPRLVFVVASVAGIVVGTLAAFVAIALARKSV